jgi:serine/threonine protein kinase
MTFENNFNQDSELIGKKIHQYTIVRFISKGGFGKVYKVASDEKTFAIKIPIIEKKRSIDNLEYEFKTINELSNRDKGIMNVRLLEYPIYKYVLMMDLLGNSLEDTKINNVYELANIFTDIVNTLEYVHSLGYIHRDITPKNFTYSPINKGKLFLIDFGLASRWCKSSSCKETDHVHEHINRDKDGLCGTMKYMSINSHRFLKQSRRDDLESAMYTIVDIYKEGLPWKKKTNKSKKYNLSYICKQKQEIKLEETYPELKSVFGKVFSHIRNLGWTMYPEYIKIKSHLRNKQESDSY